MFAHFLAAPDPVYPVGLAELQAGDKRTHWMWYIFPQLTALGRSANAGKRHPLNPQTPIPPPVSRCYPRVVCML